jgi:hypothetical protein
MPRWSCSLAIFAMPCEKVTPVLSAPGSGSSISHADIIPTAAPNNPTSNPKCNLRAVAAKSLACERATTARHKRNTMFSKLAVATAIVVASLSGVGMQPKCTSTASTSRGSRSDSRAQPPTTEPGRDWVISLTSRLGGRSSIGRPMLLRMTEMKIRYGRSLRPPVQLEKQVRLTNL